MHGLEVLPARLRNQAADLHGEPETTGPPGSIPPRADDVVSAWEGPIK